MALISYLTVSSNGDGHLTNLPIRGTEVLIDGESGISYKPSRKLGPQATNHEKWMDFQDADQSPIGCDRSTGHA